MIILIFFIGTFAQGSCQLVQQEVDDYLSNRTMAPTKFSASFAKPTESLEDVNKALQTIADPATETPVLTVKWKNSSGSTRVQVAREDGVNKLVYQPSGYTSSTPVNIREVAEISVVRKKSVDAITEMARNSSEPVSVTLHLKKPMIIRGARVSSVEAQVQSFGPGKIIRVSSEQGNFDLSNVDYVWWNQPWYRSP